MPLIPLRAGPAELWQPPTHTLSPLMDAGPCLGLSPPPHRAASLLAPECGSCCGSCDIVQTPSLLPMGLHLPPCRPRAPDLLAYPLSRPLPGACSLQTNRTSQTSPAIGTHRGGNLESKAVHGEMAFPPLDGKHNLKDISPRVAKGVGKQSLAFLVEDNWPAFRKTNWPHRST